jgi:hypothetical protein
MVISTIPFTGRSRLINFITISLPCKLLWRSQLELGVIFGDCMLPGDLLIAWTFKNLETLHVMADELQRTCVYHIKYSKITFTFAV